MSTKQTRELTLAKPLGPSPRALPFEDRKLDTATKALISYEEAHRLLEYHPDTGVFVWKVTRGRKAKAGDVAGTVERNGFRRIRVSGRPYLAGRLAWMMTHNGEWPPTEVVRA